MSTYVIGDVQGCFDELQDLLATVGFIDGTDQLWFCGDLVNRGPKSLETLRFVKNLNLAPTVTLGNHDLHFLAVASGAHSLKKKDTLDALLAADDCTELCEWLSQQPLFYYDETLNIAASHAGIPPIWTLAEARAFSQEISDVLSSSSRKDFFEHMYGDKPHHWHDGQLTGWRRLRMITNYFTRMRFCDARGHLLLGGKTTPDSAPSGYMPWFEIPSQLPDDLTVLFGHWAALRGEVGNDAAIQHLYALDTGCVWGGHLSALRLEDKCLFQVPAREVYL
jgi:bis(5'-nucleosyl)-tetraphosphatase (symmetrical)